MKNWISILGFVLTFSTTLLAQELTESIDVPTIVNAYLSNSTIDDKEIGYKIVDQYKNKGVTYLYLQQTFQDVPIDGAINTVIINKTGKVFSNGDRWVHDIKDKVSWPQSERTRLEGIKDGAKILGFNGQQLRTIYPKRNNVFTSKFTEEEITINKVWVNSSGKYRQAYVMPYYLSGGKMAYEVITDISTGELIEKRDLILRCRFADGAFQHQHTPREAGVPKGPPVTRTEIENNLIDGAQYNVYPLPGASPTDVPQTLVVEPAILEASPFGWHDDNGVQGTDHFITRGNNVHAYIDTAARNVSQGNEPMATNGLTFDFPHDLSKDALENDDAAIVNLFYVNNMGHDISYLLGFNEVAGNYQVHNFNNGGLEGDHVRAEGLDGSGRNNANFSISRDGTRGRMQMFLFDKILSLVEVESPASLENMKIENAGAQFGPRIADVNIEAEVAVALTDVVGEETFGCETVTSDVNGKIALIDRGGCDFSLKALKAQEAGAVMAIVCNVAGVQGGTGEELFTMGNGEGAEQVNIPAVFMRKSSCDLIRLTIQNGDKVVLSARDRELVGPRTFDSDFDNGIILHEYAHGISTRLTGGPGTAGCLPAFDDDGDGFRERGEQMGEGWSDFFGLIATTLVGETGDMPRGIGTFVSGNDRNGQGFRAVSYTTDMSINPLTYQDIQIANSVHAVGTVWCTMIWDLYWEFIELYGFDPDWKNTESGNYRAAFLVFEGMKMQPCRPGFVDGRNAILQADQVHYGGIHERMIWEVFARRGLGFLADQGSSLTQRDGKEDFSIPPLLIEELKLSKNGPEHITPGDVMDIVIDIVNHIPETQTNVIIVDTIPEAASYVVGSGSIEPTIDGNVLSFNLGVMAYQAERTVTYQLESDPDLFSTQLFLDDFEGNVDQWSTENRRGGDIWMLSANSSRSGENSFFTPENATEENDHILIGPLITVAGERPVWRFWHQYNVANALNGGFVEMREANEEKWNRIAERFVIRNRYPGELSFNTFAIAALEGYSGSTDSSFIDSYIDLQGFQGKRLQFRYRFGAGGLETGEGTNTGWFIDDVELMDLRTYNSRAVCFSDQAPEIRISNNWISVIPSKVVSSTHGGDEEVTYVKLFPNPAIDKVTVEMPTGIQGVFPVSIFDLSGKLMSRSMKRIENNLLNVDVRELPTGSYLVEISTDQGIYSGKLMVH